MKVKITAWFDKDVVDGFKKLADRSPGAKYQALMNEALKEYLDKSEDQDSLEKRIARLEKALKLK